MAVSLRQRKRWRGPWQRKRRQGRPRHTPSPGSAVSGVAVVRLRPRLSLVGVPLLAHWLDHQGAFDVVVAQLTQAIEPHQHTPPDDDFALLHHHEQTRRHRLQARFFAPRFGIEPRTAFATHEHPLATRLGRSSQRSPLTQCLGQRERVGAAAALVPTLVPAHAGQSTSLDGHRMASWSRVALHQGQSPMRGRIMAGSHAVIAPHEAGYAVFVASHPPALPWSRVMVAYGPQGVEATGSPRFVIDRAVHALALAAACAAPDGGLWCRLDENEPPGLESCEATREGTLDDGPQVSTGAWQAPQDDEAPRHCVSVEPVAGQTLVSWGPPKRTAALASTAGPRGDRERTERQDNRVKRLSDQGALETNDGRKKIGGPDRPQQRKREALEASLETAPQRVGKQVEALPAHQAKGEEARSKGQGKRLEQRQQALVRVAPEGGDAQHHQATLVEQVDAFEPPKERADRDCRTQTIMTWRTLLLEKALMACMAARVGHRHSKVSLAGVLHMLLERSGASLETASAIVYGVNTTGLSLPYRRLLEVVVDGLGAMDLRAQGKPIRVGLKDMPP